MVPDGRPNPPRRQRSCGILRPNGTRSTGSARPGARDEGQEAPLPALDSHRTPMWAAPTARALTGLLGVVLVLAAAPTPVVSGPRPPLSAYTGVAGPWSPPPPHVGADFATHPFTPEPGVEGTWVIGPQLLPLEMTIEQDVVDRFGRDAVRQALATWNNVPGSRFGVEVAGTADTGADRRRRDHVNRVFLDRTMCAERYLARAHLFPDYSEVREGTLVSWVNEVDIGICERLTPDRLGDVMAHELGHVAGLGHLCDMGDACWDPRMAQENRCRIMSPASYDCQEPQIGDRSGLVHLHPVAPRVAGADAVELAAAASRVTHPRPRSASTVVMVAQDADPDLQAAAGAAAARADAPLLVTDGTCTDGPDGEALNRVAAVGATVLIVGPMPGRCQDALAGWELPADHVPDLDALTERWLEHSSTRQVVLVPHAASSGDHIAVSALAAPVAAALDAPIIPTDPRELTSHGLLSRIERPGVVIVAGGPALVHRAVTDELQQLGWRVRRLQAVTRAQLGVKLARMRDAFPMGSLTPIIVADDAVSAGATGLAAHLRAPLLPTGDRLDPRVQEMLEAHAQAAAVAAPWRLVPREIQGAVARAVDRG